MEEAVREAEHELLVRNVAQSIITEDVTDGFGFDNIVGVGVSQRRVSRRGTGETAVAVYVAQKAPRNRVDDRAIVPDSYQGVPTDVIETGVFVGAGVRDRHRPTPLGVSIGHVSGNTGTLGFLAERDNELLVVSNNHVLARENQAAKGDDILQPGVADGGGDDDKLAKLAEWIRLDFIGMSNPVDAAMAVVEDGMVSGCPYEGGSFDPIPTTADIGVGVRKCGRTSGFSRGVVVGTDSTVKVQYATGFAFLSDQVVIQGIDDRPFSERGDSGSLVIAEGTNRPVGLICGGSETDNYSVANQIDLVLEGLGVSFRS